MPTTLMAITKANSYIPNTERGRSRFGKTVEGIGWRHR